MRAVFILGAETCVHVVRSIREQRRSVTVLLAGTSGTGKSTLAGLLAARLGISTVLSTDSVRHMLRSFTPQAANPLLWASTYEVRAPAPAGPVLSRPGLSESFKVTGLVCKHKVCGVQAGHSRVSALHISHP